MASSGRARHGLAALVGLAAMMFAAPAARAGDWMQVSCVNPSGTAAGSQGWTSFTQGTVGAGDGNNTQCAPGSPMTAALGTQSVAVNGESEVLEYAPPAGSTLAGGSLQAFTAAYGGHQEAATAQADVLEPQEMLDQSDAVFLCVNGQGCGSASTANDVYSGPVSLPDRGGDVFVTAVCTALSGYNCDQSLGGSDGYWAFAQVISAHLLLSSGASPGGTGFSGSILQPGAGATAHLVFTATDASGPGVYVVTVKIDGQTIFSGTPNTNGGACAPVGTDSSTGALMFDSAQPCPASTAVDVPITTTGLADGAHELVATVTDAAENTSTVLDQTVTTSNPQLTPVPAPASRPIVRAQFRISWHWRGRTTVLRTITVRRLPRNASVSVTCRGPGCPQLKLKRVRAKRASRLLGELSSRRLRSGDRLLIVVTAPGHAAERIRVTIRTSRRPLAQLLKP
jgi:hypothetical protein